MSAGEIFEMGYGDELEPPRLYSEEKNRTRRNAGQAIEKIFAF